MSKYISLQFSLNFVVYQYFYFYRAPELFLEDKQGISDARASELLTELLNFSKKHCGNEIIYQLAQLVQVDYFLTDVYYINPLNMFNFVNTNKWINIFIS